MGDRTDPFLETNTAGVSTESGDQDKFQLRQATLESSCSADEASAEQHEG
jgi:hypothetical protein